MYKIIGLELVLYTKHILDTADTIEQANEMQKEYEYVKGLGWEIDIEEI